MTISMLVWGASGWVGPGPRTRLLAEGSGKWGLLDEFILVRKSSGILLNCGTGQRCLNTGIRNSLQEVVWDGVPAGVMGTNVWIAVRRSHNIL